MFYTGKSKQHNLQKEKSSRKIPTDQLSANCFFTGRNLQKHAMRTPLLAGK